MSLILDALKKTESTKEKTETTDQTKPSTEPAASTPLAAPQQKEATPLNTRLNEENKKRLLIIAALGSVALCLVLYLAFSRGLTTLFDSKPEPQKIVTSTAQHKITDTKETKKQTSEQDIIKLKKEAIALFRSGKYAESSSVYKKLVNLLPANPEIYNNYGLSLKKAGKTNEAKQAYQISLALNEDYPEALNNLAVIELSEQNYNDAKIKLTKAIELNPKYIDAHLHLALCLEKMGALTEAQNKYQSFLTLSEGKISRKIRLQVENRLSLITDEIASK